jgi:pyruvate dehydrogenase (quinone)
MAAVAAGKERQMAEMVADELPNIPHLELDLAARYAIAKVKEAVIAVTGR